MSCRPVLEPSQEMCVRATLLSGLCTAIDGTSSPAHLTAISVATKAVDLLTGQQKTLSGFLEIARGVQKQFAAYVGDEFIDSDDNLKESIFCTKKNLEEFRSSLDRLRTSAVNSQHLQDRWEQSVVDMCDLCIDLTNQLHNTLAAIHSTILKHDTNLEEERQDIKDVLNAWDEPDGATLDEINVRYGI